MLDLTIRRITERDLASAGAVLNGAFRSDHSWDDELARYLALQPEGWLLAEREGVPAGTAGALDYGPFAHIGLVAVRPDLQRSGVGLALMERLLAWLDARGCPATVHPARGQGPVGRRHGLHRSRAGARG